MAFEGDIQVINGLVPANGNDFPLVEASHVYVDDNNNLDDKLTATDNRMDTIAGDVAAKDTAIRGMIGANNGIASLGSDGKVPSSQLPSYVDDVLEYPSKTGSEPGVDSFPTTGEAGKIYIAVDTALEYRWTGSVYAELAKASDVLDDSEANGSLVKTWSSSKIHNELVSRDNAIALKAPITDVSAIDGRVTALEGAVPLKAPKASPEFTGSISMGRKSGSAIGVRNVATGDGVIGAANFSHVFGTFNKGDSYANWPEYESGTFYDIGAKCKVTRYFPEYSTETYYVCNTAHMYMGFDETKWDEWGNKMNYAEIVGNGLDDSHRSNARTLDWQGNEYLAGGLTLGDGSKGLQIGNTILSETTLIRLINMLNGNS